MLRRVADIAAAVCRKNSDCEYLVATDDARIEAFCTEHGIPVTMTPEACASGTERCRAVAARLNPPPKLIINLQGDNPLCPPHVIQGLIDAWRQDEADVFTPCVHLSWPEYERLVESKRSTPYSGTTVLVDSVGNALAFSKQIIPAIRDITKAKNALELSPVRRHIGLYAYTFPALERYFSLPASHYEQGYIEGLEQMRFLENGLKVRMVEVDYRGRKTSSGVDSPEDVGRVEAILAEFGELDLS